MRKYAKRRVISVFLCCHFLISLLGQSPPPPPPPTHFPQPESRKILAAEREAAGKSDGVEELAVATVATGGGDHCAR